MTNLSTLAGDPVAPFAFGTMQFGGGADEPASRALYDACRQAGIRHFDTAWVYTDGASETILGRCIKTERDRVFVATKASYAKKPTRDVILRSFDDSRRRLGTDVIDLLYMHRWHDDPPLEETFETLAGLQEQGVLKHIGVSNYAAWQVMKAQCIAGRLGTRIDVIQPMYNLVKRQAEVELLPMAAAEGVLPVCYSPLGAGLLSGKYVGGSGEGRLAKDKRYAARYGQTAMHQAAAGLVKIAREVGADPATLAVAWVAAHPAHPVPILSARSVAQIRPSLDGMRYPLDQGLYDQLANLMPSPPPATDRLEET